MKYKYIEERRQTERLTTEEVEVVKGRDCPKLWQMKRPKFNSILMAEKKRKSHLKLNMMKRFILGAKSDILLGILLYR